MTDHRALITRMADELDRYLRCLLDDRRVTHPLADRARVELAADGPAVQSREPASVVGQPSDEGLLEIARTVALIEEDGSTGYLDFADVSHLVLDFARAVLARWGHQSAPPAEGEVAELVEALQEQANYGICDMIGDDKLTRAADLLAQRHPAPVPVASDIYFEFVISDADYCTQAGGIAPTYAQALSEGQHYLAQYQQDGPHTLELRRVEVLNPDALPLPAGEQRQPAPAPVPDPTDEQLLATVDAVTVTLPLLPDAHSRITYDIAWRIAMARAVLARWGGQAAPVPVSERLPGDQLCWWYEPDEEDGYGGRWTLLRIRGGTASYTHWLPATALPLPAGEVE